MVTTRRQIRTEQDRFGGYSTRQSMVSDIEREQDTESVSVSDSDFTPTYRNAAPTYRNAAPAVTKEPAPSLYTTRKDYPDTAEFVGGIAYPSRHKKPVRRDAEDVMPSIKTRKALGGETDKAVAVRKEKSALSNKSKAVLAIYAVVVVALAAIVIATGIAISSLGSSVASLQDELAFKSEVVTQQNAELSALDNNTTMTGQATDLGMVKPSHKTEVELLEVSDPVSYEAKTNWFDRFCDWLSNLIGG